MRVAVALAIALASCTRESPRAPEPAPEPSARAPSASATPSATPPAAKPEQRDPDGNDEIDAPFVIPARGNWTKVGRHWSSLQRICDFASHGDTLLIAHATEPLGLGGATLTRYRAAAPAPFALAFDWNRPGEPEKGGGAAGQGFLRIRAIDGRLWVPDADPPYLGFRVAPGIAEGYVFVSDEAGQFERARRPGHRPPASAVVLPGALHVFDVIRWRARIYASASAVVPASGKNAGSPGTLFVKGDDERRWEVAFTYPGATERGARLGYMTRFRDRLYVALSPLDASDPNDFIVLDSLEKARPVSVTGSASHTLRWYAHGGRLYWIAATHAGVGLFVSADGDRWQTLELPAELGKPADLLAAGERLLVLGERGLYELGERGARAIAPITDAKTPFGVDDPYCAPPLAIHAGKLYAGAQRQGALYALEPSE